MVNTATVATNDRISTFLGDFVPNALQGTDSFIDIITWNIRFFNGRDQDRVDAIASIMQELNADIFVLQEIEQDSLDEVAEILNDAGAGLYRVVYGTTGGDQRVAFMYDTEWVRASTNIRELFPDNPTVEVNTDRGIRRNPVFPRLPLYGRFVVRATTRTRQGEQQNPFDFDLVGVHLKSQRGGGQEQRAEAARLLANWIMTESSDEDVIIAGDWNAPADRPEWQPIRDLEAQVILNFQGFNNNNEGTYLRVGGERSRLDFIAVTDAISDATAQRNTSNANDGVGESIVINWNVLSRNQQGQQARETLNQLIDIVSDHLPVLTRFYFTDRD